MLLLAENVGQASTNSNWVWSISLIISALNLIGLVAGFITAGVNWRKYLYEKNRDIFIRRLNEVYAPLYGLLVKQETLRKIRLAHIKREDAPIITLVKRTSKETLNLTGATLSREESEEVGELDRKNFLKVLNDTNRGLARPQLLNLLFQYEMLIYLEESKVHDEGWQKAATEKVRIENLLIKEIVHGYRDTIKSLDIDDNHSLIMTEDFFEGT